MNLLYFFVIYPLTQLIEFVFSFCNKIFDNIGISILGVSCAVSLFTLPLYIVAEHWQQVERDKQKAMKAQVSKIKEVFHGNEQYMILSTYYRQQHYHPIMSLRSAFGLLIQIPFFTAAYSCLSQMSALQGQSFGFIRDMGAPDALFSIGSFQVNVLPILMTLINLVSGTIYTKGLSIRDKLQTYGLALVFVIILYDSPSGLVAYWTMNNLFSLVKNVFYKMKHPVKTLYYIACILVTLFIAFLFAGHALSIKRALLVSACFSLIYFSPLIIKLCNWLIDKPFATLRDNQKLRIILFALSSFSLCILIGFLIPSLLISSSPEEFCEIDGIAKPTFFILNTLSQATGVFIIWTSLIFFLYKNRIQTLISAGMCLLLSMALVNAFLFQEHYGNLSNLLVFTNISTVDSSFIRILINAICLFAAVVAICFIIKFNFTKILNIAIGLICFSLLMLSAMNVNTINRSYKAYSEKMASNSSGYEKEIKPFIHMSKEGKNVILLYLDRAQSRFILPLLKELPELQNQFKGFTFYPNTVSYNSHTLLGAPACYGGYEYTPEKMNERKDVELVKKQNEALLLLPRIFTEQGKEYSAIVTDPTWANYGWTPDLSIYKDYPSITPKLTDAVYLDAWNKEHSESAKFTVTSTVLKRNILWYGFFRTSPLVLRPAWYNNGKYWSTNSTAVNYIDFLNGYSALDYLVRFTDFESESKNVYLNFVNNTPHDDLLLQDPEYRPSLNVKQTENCAFKDDGSYSSFAGSLRRVGEWFEFLQKNEAYDNSRIVIVADHGAPAINHDFEHTENTINVIPEKYHPLLMFKDFGSSGDVKIDRTFMTNADAPYLLLAGEIEEAKNPFTGKAIKQDKDNGALICTSNIFMPYHNKSQYVFTAAPDEWWRVKENIFKSDNWTQETK